MSLIEKWKKTWGILNNDTVIYDEPAPIVTIEADLRKVIDELKPIGTWKNPDKLDGYIMALIDIKQKIGLDDGADSPSEQSGCEK